MAHYFVILLRGCVGPAAKRKIGNSGPCVVFLISCGLLLTFCFVSSESCFYIFGAIVTKKLVCFGYPWFPALHHRDNWWIYGWISKGHVPKALEMQEVQWFNTTVVVLSAQGGFTPLRSLLDFRMWHCRDSQCPLQAAVHNKDFCFLLEQFVLFPEFLVRRG